MAGENTGHNDTFEITTISGRPMDANKRSLALYLRPSTSFHEIKNFCQGHFGEVPVNRVVARIFRDGQKRREFTDKPLTPANCEAMLKFLAVQGEKAILVLHY